MPAERPLNSALQPIEVTRVGGTAMDTRRDVAAVEEPLELRVNGQPFVVIMRTPGADRELAAGFLYSERIVAVADDIHLIRHCSGPDGAVTPNVVHVQLAADASQRLNALLAGRRPTAVSSACGVCGRRTIDELLVDLEPIRAGWRVTPGFIAALPAALRAVQAGFDESGGLHAAGLFDREARLLAGAEDVGRHNAVDKVIGRRLLTDEPSPGEVLMVSGRAGYEIVQKALVARIPVLASVSAPTSLAVQLAREGGLTLLGFVRDGGFNIYAGAERIDAP